MNAILQYAWVAKWTETRHTDKEWHVRNQPTVPQWPIPKHAFARAPQAQRQYNRHRRRTGIAQRVDFLGAAEEKSHRQQPCTWAHNHNTRGDLLFNPLWWTAADNSPTQKHTTEKQAEIACLTFCDASCTAHVTAELKYIGANARIDVISKNMYKEALCTEYIRVIYTFVPIKWQAHTAPTCRCIFSYNTHYIHTHVYVRCGWQTLQQRGHCAMRIKCQKNPFWQSSLC